MKRSNRLVLLIGIFLALVAFVLIAFTLNGGSGTAGPSASPLTATVVVAARDIDLGATLEAADLTTKEMPLENKPADSFGDVALVIGQTARTDVKKGQLMTSAIFSATGAIADIKVPAGFVAMSVQVDQVTGVGTIVKPGDFVDVISGFTGSEQVPLVEAAPGPTPKNGVPDLTKVEDSLYNHTTVKVLAQGLQVLGTLLPAPPPSADGQATPVPQDSTTTLNGQLQIVILAVSPQDAEVIKFSQIDGNISLVLRSADDCTVKPLEGQTYCPVVATSGITLRRLVDDRGVLPPPIVQIIQPTVRTTITPAASPSPSPSASATPAP